MSEWSVRRKVVAVLALPVILAVVFGGLRVSSELTSASDYSMNQQRSLVLGPAVTYLAATERLALPPSLADRMGGDGHGDANQAYADALGVLKSGRLQGEPRRHPDRPDQPDHPDRRHAAQRHGHGHHRHPAGRSSARWRA